MKNNTSKKNLGNKTTSFDLTVDKTFIADLYKSQFDKLASELVAPGFRKGAAPESVAEIHIK